MKDEEAKVLANKMYFYKHYKSLLVTYQAYAAALSPVKKTRSRSDSGAHYVSSIEFTLIDFPPTCHTILAKAVEDMLAETQRLMEEL